jgi:hypothetical protein
MGAAVDHDMQKSFARATGGPASMRGGKVNEDTIVTEVYRFESRISSDFP